MQIDLSEDEFEVLILALGYAAGAASKDNVNPSLVDSFIRVANAVNRNNPRWTNYEIPDLPPAVAT
jgi:hypothetical protein